MPESTQVVSIPVVKVHTMEIAELKGGGFAVDGQLVQGKAELVAAVCNTLGIETKKRTRKPKTAE